MKWTAKTSLAIASSIAAVSLQHDPVKKLNPVPVALMSPEGHFVFFTAHAAGTQIYVCKAKADDPNRFEWVLKAPDGDLFDDGGQRIGLHLGGPTRQASDEGSEVVGTPIEKVPAPNDRDIPWLLLKRKSGEDQGRFSLVTYIQRVETEGGIAPSGGYDKADRDREVRVKYKATYEFYGARK